jgi:hypothetical protein
MCTVSWLHSEDGYELFCNRDEKRTRSIARRPDIAAYEGVRFIAPQDTEAGGTWIAVNEYGVSLCLLNGRYHERRERDPSHLSRGLVLTELLTASSLSEACERAWSIDLSRYWPFTLLILEAGQHASAVEWNGHDKAILLNADAYMPLTSSSVDYEGVRLRRQKEFQAVGGSPESLNSRILLSLHRSHGASADAYSACMHRPDAETVSFSRVTVTHSETQFFYSPAAPCRRVPGETRTLPLLQ